MLKKNYTDKNNFNLQSLFTYYYEVDFMNIYLV